MPTNHKSGQNGGHHHHHHKRPKASTMATRKSEGKQKLLSKTYSEIGVAPGHNNSSAETPTPSEKVSRWHRDILLVSPNTPGGAGAGANANNPHPRQCICDQCMAEYGTYRIYNQLLDINPHSSVIKVQEDIAEEQVPAPPPVNPVKNDKVRHCLFIFLNG